MLVKYVLRIGVVFYGGNFAHFNVLDITQVQHAEIERLRHDVRQLMPHLSEQGIYTSLNHVASGLNGPLTAGHLATRDQVARPTRIPATSTTPLPP